MSSCINKLLERVYAGETSPAYETRLKMLYGVLFQTVPDKELEAVYNEAEEYEQTAAAEVRMTVNSFLSPKPELILQEFSALSFSCALKRFKTKKTSRLADYQHEIFSGICDDTSIISADMSKKYAKLISETLLDFDYAAGRTECTSLRLHAVIM